MVGPTIDFLNTFFWQFTTVIVGIVAVIGFLVYRYYLEPPLARQLTSAKWKGGQPAFIENESGEVEFITSDRGFPEGLRHYKGKGWFCNAIRDVSELGDVEETSVKRGPGRPPKVDPNAEPILTDKEKEETMEDEVLQMVTHTPVLKGFGKHVFFGSISSVALTGLKTIAHADLRKTRLLAPRMYSKTQLAALADGSKFEGMKMMGGDKVKWIFYVILACIPLGVTGFIVFLLLNKGA